MTEQPLAKELGQTEIVEKQHSHTSEELSAQSRFVKELYMMLILLSQCTSDTKELESELKSIEEELPDVKKISLLKTREIEPSKSESKMTKGILYINHSSFETNLGKTGQIMELPLVTATEKLGQAEEQPSNTSEKLESLSTQSGFVNWELYSIVVIL